MSEKMSDFYAFYVFNQIMRHTLKYMITLHIPK